MTANFANIKSSYWLLEKSHSENLEARKLREGFEKLTILIKHALSSNQEFPISAYKFFGEIFQLRLNSFNYILNQKIDIGDMYDEILESFEKKSDNKIFEQLIENIAFGVRTLNRVSKRIISHEKSLGKEGDFRSEYPIFDISYEDFYKLMKENMSNFPEEISKSFFDLFDASLMLEVSLISADILIDNFNNLNFSEKKIYELESSIRDNSQLYGSAAIALGMIGDKKTKTNISNINGDWIQEQKNIAEMGIKEYLKGMN